MQNRALVGIGGVQFQKQNLNPDGFPPALSSSGGLAEVRPGTEILQLARPQLQGFWLRIPMSLSKNRRLKSGTPSSNLRI